MQKFTLLILCTISPFFLMAQYNNGTLKQAMENLSFLEGEWAGNGWQMGQDRQKHTFTQTEDISFEADGEVLLIRGLGKNMTAEGKEKVIHNAFAMVSFNPTDDDYDFRSYVAGRGAGNFKAKLIKKNHFEWYLEAPQSKIKYTITLNEKGQWHEIGEIAMGENWYKIFEMTLDKVSN